MNHPKHRFFSLILAVCTLFGCLLPGILPLTAKANDFPNTYINTGDQRKDILGVALSQIGFTEGSRNETPYGAWYGMPNQSWCATFISWCATQADVGTHILKRSAIAAPDYDYFNIPYYDGATYTPQPGDLFFTKNFSHVGFVYYVEGDYFYTIEGNTNLHDPDNPKPSDAEGLYVMTNHRRTKDYYFGVPAYEGGDKSHSYVKGHDDAHPHNTYYACTSCGDKYYTGFTAFVESCPDCLACGCSATQKGYYTSTAYLNLRSGHKKNSQVIGNVIKDEVVYVYGTCTVGEDTYAYVYYDGKRGHIPMKYLQPCPPVPNAPTLSIDKTVYAPGDTVKISWDQPQNAEAFQARIWKDGILQNTKQLGTAQTYGLVNISLGNYMVQIYAMNKAGASEAATAYFSVLDAYWVSFDTQGGANGPAAQSQIKGHSITLSETVPTRDGYTFLGWSDTKDSNSVAYRPGDSFVSNKDVTLYAVWKSDAATMQALSIEQLPAKRQYALGEALNTEGLKLKLLYSDGSSLLVTDGFTTEGFSSEQAGSCTVTVTYEGYTVTFDVQIVDYIPGDINLDGKVNRDDVSLLLRHVVFPDLYPLSVPADFTADNKENRDDVSLLLRHVVFPDLYPLLAEID